MRLLARNLLLWGRKKIFPKKRLLLTSETKGSPLSDNWLLKYELFLIVCTLVALQVLQLQFWLLRNSLYCCVIVCCTFLMLRTLFFMATIKFCPSDLSKLKIFPAFLFWSYIKSKYLLWQLKWGIICLQCPCLNLMLKKMSLTYPSQSQHKIDAGVQSLPILQTLFR